MQILKKRLFYFFFISIACLITLGGCGKSKKNTGNNTTVTKARNPVTAVASCDYDVADTVLTNHGWTKTFEDNFSGGLSNWNLLTGGVKNELQCYEPANVQIVNGVAQISAKQETVTGPQTVGSANTQSFNYTSGWMISNTPLASANSSTPKVRIVARLKVPSGYGLTAVFNGFGSAAWPTGGEIDYVEIQSDDTREYGTDYQYGTQADVNLVSGGFLFNPTTADLSLCYHVYMMEWTQNSLNSYLDGKLVETKTAGGHVPDLFGKSHSLSFSLPVGGGNYGSSLNTANIKTGTLYVDYVKVFTSN